MAGTTQLERRMCILFLGLLFAHVISALPQRNCSLSAKVAKSYAIKSVTYTDAVNSAGEAIGKLTCKDGYAYGDIGDASRMIPHCRYDKATGKYSWRVHSCRPACQLPMDIAHAVFHSGVTVASGDYWVATQVCQNGYTMVGASRLLIRQCRVANGSAYWPKIKAQCVDVDECLSSSICDQGSEVCLNTAGSFKCMCKPGYVGNGTTCQASSACGKGIAQTYKAEDGTFKYFCQCAKHGYFYNPGSGQCQRDGPNREICARLIEFTHYCTVYPRYEYHGNNGTASVTCPKGMRLAGTVCKAIYAQCRQNKDTIMAWTALAGSAFLWNRTAFGQHGQPVVLSKLPVVPAAEQCTLRGLRLFSYDSYRATPRQCLFSMLATMARSGRYAIPMIFSTDMHDGQGAILYSYEPTLEAEKAIRTKNSSAAYDVLCAARWTTRTASSGLLASYTGVSPSIRPRFAEDGCNSIGFPMLSEPLLKIFSADPLFMSALWDIVQKDKTMARPSTYYWLFSARIESQAPRQFTMTDSKTIVYRTVPSHPDGSPLCYKPKE